MNRQSLEEKLFAYQELSSAEKRALDKLVKTDPELASLSEGWKALEAQLTIVETSSPQPGFRQRWLEIYEEDKLRQEKIQAAWITFFSILAALALLTLLMQRVIPSYYGLKQLFFAFLNGLTEFVSLVQIVISVSLSLFQKIPTGNWASMAGMILFLPLFWYAVFQELSLTKGVYK